MQPYFLKLKNNLELNKTFADSISTRHNAIRSYVEKNHLGFVDSKLIGSLQRNTRIQPASDQKFDIDILVVMGDFTRWVQEGGVTPSAALDALHTTISDSDRYSAMDPSPNPPTIEFTYGDDVGVELVPAYIDNIGTDPMGNILGHVGRGYWVAKGGTWQMADYDHEANYIAEQNRISDGYLVPTIKMLKAIKNVHFPELHSFPLEIIAAEIIPVSVISRKLRNQAITYPDLIRDFFVEAPSYLTSLHIPNSKSDPIALGNATILSLKQTFGGILNFIDGTQSKTSEADNISSWKVLLPHHFPTTL